MNVDNQINFFVEAKNINYTINNKPIIADFSYVFSPGKLYIFVGESGCGKTTLLSLLATYLKPSKGEMFFSNGIKKNDISFFSESFSCFFDMTLYQNLSIFSKNDAYIDEILFLVGLLDKKSQKTNTLSKGEIARLALARMIIYDNPILFFDEPTTNLDFENKKMFFSILRYLCQTKIVIVASHDLQLIDKNDIVLKYNNNHSFEQGKIIKNTSVECNDIYFGSKKSNIKRSISLTDKFGIIKNIFKRNIKQFILLFPLFFFLYFSCISSTAFIAKTGNKIFYENLTSCNINGTLLQDYTGNGDFVFDGTYSTINNNNCVTLFYDKNPVHINNLKYTIEKENEAVIPFSYANKLELNIGDSFQLMMSNESKKFYVSNIYQYNEIITSSFLSNIVEDRLSSINIHNQPIIISIKAASKNDINDSIKYAVTDYFKKADSLTNKNYLLESLNQNVYDIIVNKQSYNVPYFYFLWISMALITISSYFYSIITTNAIKKDLMIFKLTKNNIIDPILASSLGGFIYLTFLDILNLICLTITTPFINKLISRFYLPNSNITILTVSPITLAFSIIILVINMILIVVLITIVEHIKAYTQINRLE